LKGVGVVVVAKSASYIGCLVGVVVDLSYYFCGLVIA
jgi:hypothetical protein